MINHIKTFSDCLKARFQSLHNDENGMEAAQVILILALVILGLVPIIRTIVSKVAQQGNLASNCLDQATSVNSTC